MLCLHIRLWIWSLGIHGKGWADEDSPESNQNIFRGSKNTTSVTLLAEMNWLDLTLRANLQMVRQFQRIQKMKSDRLPKIIFLWDKKISEQNEFRTWYREFKIIHETNNMTQYFKNNLCCKLKTLRLSMKVKQSVELRAKCALKPKINLFNEITDLSQLAFNLQTENVKS